MEPLIITMSSIGILAFLVTTAQALGVFKPPKKDKRWGNQEQQKIKKAKLSAQKAVNIEKRKRSYEKSRLSRKKKKAVDLTEFPQLLLQFSKELQDYVDNK
jgi:hypothetical protein